MSVKKQKGQTDFEKELKIRKNWSGCYSASWTLSDGYVVSCTAAPDQKANAAKDTIKTELWRMVQDRAQSRGCEIFSK